MREITHDVQNYLSDFKQEANWLRKKKGVVTIHCPRSLNRAVILVPRSLIGKRVKVEVSYLPEGTEEVYRIYRTTEAVGRDK